LPVTLGVALSAGLSPCPGGAEANFSPGTGVSAWEPAVDWLADPWIADGGVGGRCSFCHASQRNNIEVEKIRKSTSFCVSILHREFVFDSTPERTEVI
jgi:hypothetical protein